MIQESPWGASPAVVVEAKEVAAWLASRVLPVAGPPNGQPVVEGPRLQVVHHRLVPPHTVGEGDGQPAAGTKALAGSDERHRDGHEWEWCQQRPTPGLQRQCPACSTGRCLKSDICIERHSDGHRLPAVPSCLTLRWHWRSENACREGQRREQQEEDGLGIGVILEPVPHAALTKAMANLQGKGKVLHQFSQGQEVAGHLGLLAAALWFGRGSMQPAAQEADSYILGRQCEACKLCTAAQMPLSMRGGHTWY